MTRIATTNGSWYDYDRMTRVGTNQERDDSRWVELRRTAAGQYIRARISCVNGELDSHEPIENEEAARLCAAWATPAGEVPDELRALVDEKEL